MGGSDGPPRQSSGAEVALCSELTFNATVNSPKPTVLKALNTGLILELSVTPGNTSIEVRYKNLSVGALTGNRIVRLIACIQSGFEFVAEVVSLADGHCVVRVREK